MDNCQNLGSYYLQTVNRRNALCIIFLIFISAMVQTAFAQSKACADEREKVNLVKDKCTKIAKEDQSKCLELLKAQIAKANKACEAANQESAKPAAAPAPTPPKTSPKPSAKPAANPKPAKPAPKPAAAQPKPEVAPSASDFEEEPEEDPHEFAAFPADSPKPAVAQPAEPVPAAAPPVAGVSETCMEEFVNLPKKNDNFNISNFIKELVPATLKTKAQAKLPFGKPKDSEKTSIGITVGCLKAFPESTNELQALLLKIIPSIVESMVVEHGVNKAKGMLEDKLNVSKNEMRNLNSIEQLRNFAEENGAESSIIEAFDAVKDGLSFIKEIQQGRKADLVSLSEKLGPMTNALNILKGGSEEEDVSEDDYDIKPKERKPKRERNSETETRFGARANFGMAVMYPSLMNLSWQEIYMDPGLGLGLGAFAIIPVSSFHIVPEITVQYRKPVNISNEQFSFNVTETAIEASLLMRFLYNEESSIYIGVGMFAGMVLDLTQDPPHFGAGESLEDLRPSPDYGVVLEFGYRINENFSVDIRGTASAASFGIGEYLYADDTPRLIQAQLGVSYVF